MLLQRPAKFENVIELEDIFACVCRKRLIIGQSTVRTVKTIFEIFIVFSCDGVG